jgi:hypothetical protein
MLVLEMAWPYIVPTEQLFRLEKRTIASMYLLHRSFRFEANELITVTGACGGLGLAVTEAVIESGADVLCLDLPSAFATDGWSKYSTGHICHHHVLILIQGGCSQWQENMAV